MTTKCRRVDSHVYSSINWPWSWAMINKVRAWEAKILRFTFRPRMKPDETWVGFWEVAAQTLRTSLRKMGLLLLTEKFASKIWTAVIWAVYDGDVPMFYFGVENNRLVEMPSLLEYGGGTPTTYKLEAQNRFHNTGVQCDPQMARWAGEENDRIKLRAQRKPRKEDVIYSLLESMNQAVEKGAEPNGTMPTKKPRELPPLLPPPYLNLIFQRLAEGDP